MPAIYPALRTSTWSKLRRTAGMIECKLHSSKRQTAFGPLCALGHYLIQQRVLEPLRGVEIAQKTVEHSPTQKLMDALNRHPLGLRGPLPDELPSAPRPAASEGLREGALRRAVHHPEDPKRLHPGERWPTARGRGGDPPPELPDLLSSLRAGDAPVGGGPHRIEGLQEGRGLHQGLLLRRAQRHGQAAP